jgi:xylulokinase
MTLAGGSCLSWLGEILKRSIEDLLQEAEESPAGCNGVIFLPYLAGRGTPFPMTTARGAFLNLNFAVGTKDLIRSVLEGVAFAIKDIFQGFTQFGFKVREAYITGGAARAALWRRIVSDVLECPLYWAAGDATLGAAILASVGSEIHPDIPTAVKAMVRVRERVEPIPEVSSRYREIYTEYFRLGKGLGYLGRPEGVQEEKADGSVHFCGY